MNRKTRQDTMSYYSTLFQTYRVDDNLLENRAKKRAIGSILEQIDKKSVNKTDKIDRSRLKRLRKAFGKNSWFKNIAATLTFAAAVSLFQAPPLEAKTTEPIVLKQKSDYIAVSMDEDSSLVATIDNKKIEAAKKKDIETSSLHLISNKPLSNEYKLLSTNSVLLDDDSDVAYIAPNKANHLTVIDTTIEDWKTLAKSVDKGAVLLLNKDDEPLETIISELQKLKIVESLNIISHGSSGQLHFSDKTISKEELEINKAKWETLGSYLDKDGDILLYGCNIAKGEVGKEFIKTLSNITKADIGASVNPTGNKEKGGDWQLEISYGDINSKPTLSDSVFKTFKHILPLPDGVEDIGASGGGWSASGDSDGYFTTAVNTGDPAWYGDNYGAYIDNAGASPHTDTVGSYWFEIAADGTKLGTFELEKVYLRETGAGAAFSAMSIKGYDKDASSWTSATVASSIPADFFNTPYTFDLSSDGNFDGKNLSKFRVYFTMDHYGPKGMNIKGFKISNAAAPSSSDSDATLTAGATVDESSMIPLPTTADTNAEKVNVFDFTITDGGGGDTLTTDITQIVLHTSGTGDFSKVKWLLNGNDATDVEGVYNAGANTLTFSSLSISVADNQNETYTLSGYYTDPTALTDNATFGFSLDVDDNDITVDGSKTQFASTQDAVTNSTNAKVDITATKLIFIQMPSK